MTIPDLVGGQTRTHRRAAEIAESGAEKVAGFFSASALRSLRLSGEWRRISYLFEREAARLASALPARCASHHFSS